MTSQIDLLIRSDLPAASDVDYALAQTFLAITRGHMFDAGKSLRADEQIAFADRLKRYRMCNLFIAKRLHVNMRPEVQRAIQDDANRQRQRHKRLVRELRELLDLFEANSIPALPIKGPVISQLLYGDHGARVVNDLDILIHPAHVAQVDHLMRSRGYRQNAYEYFSSGEPSECPPFPLYTPSRRGLCVYERNFGGEELEVEIHLSVRHVSQAGLAALWGPKTVHRLGDTDIAAPGYARSLVLFLMDKFKDLEHGDFFSLRDIVDIDRAAVEVSQATWHEAAELADQCGCRWHLAQVMQAIHAGRLALPPWPPFHDNLWQLDTPAVFTFLTWDMLLGDRRGPAWSEAQQVLASHRLASSDVTTVQLGEDSSGTQSAPQFLKNDVGADVSVSFSVADRTLLCHVLYSSGALTALGEHGVRFAITEMGRPAPYPGRGCVILVDGAGAHAQPIAGRGLYQHAEMSDGTEVTLKRMDGRTFVTLTVPLSDPPVSGAGTSTLVNVSIRRKYFQFDGRPEYAYYTSGEKEIHVDTGTIKSQPSYAAHH